MHSSRHRLRYRRGTRTHKLYLAPLAAAALSLNCSSAPPEPKEAVLSAGLTYGATFGVGASSSFQNGWSPPLGNLDYAWNNAWSFWDHGNQAMNGRWAYNLSGAQGWWEQPSGFSDNVNSVEFFFASTHGGAWTNPARGVYAMWDQNSLASTTNMRLTNTEGFFTFACDTHKDDGHVWERWAPVFQGGLRIATGAYDVLDDGYFTDGAGGDFADNLFNSDSFASAWPDAVHSIWYSQYPSVMASGVNSTDCFNRLWNMTIYNRLNYPQLTDQVGYLCWYHVSN